jgi:DGQHR domain-containing protein
MINSFDGLIDKPLENWFQNLFKNELKLIDYFPSPGQISLSDLDPGQSPGHHLELDGILLINKTCLVLEYTGQSSSFTDKIKKFTRNCNLLINSSHLTLTEKFKLLGVPDDRLIDFEEVNQWKFVYFGTSLKFESENYSRSTFPDYPIIQSSLFLFNYSQIEYLRQLTNLIGEFAKNEFLAALNFLPIDLDEVEESFYLDFIKAENKIIATDTTIKADVYLLKFKISELLRIARVSRYEGIPFIFEDENVNYQRLLIESKLKNIANNFILNNKRKFFPNTITIVLTQDCNVETISSNLKLKIPKKFSSIDIIDGQHRLFGYTKSSINDATRNDSEILATAIRFQTTDKKQINRNAAKVFCEINSNQAKVKNNLIYLIKYDVLGERNEAAIAGKVILLCNNRPDKNALGNIFLTNSLKKKNKLGYPCIPITTIIDNDLIPLIKGLNTNGVAINETLYESIFDNTRIYYNLNPDKLNNKVKTIMEIYFSYVKSTFKNDWCEDTNSYLISSKYISAFIRILRYNLFEQGKTLTDMLLVLKNLKIEVDTVVIPTIKKPSFPKGNLLIPSTKHGINTIFEFLKTPKSYK